MDADSQHQASTWSHNTAHLSPYESPVIPMLPYEDAQQYVPPWFMSVAETWSPTSSMVTTSFRPNSYHAPPWPTYKTIALEGEGPADWALDTFPFGVDGAGHCKDGSGTTTLLSPEADSSDPIQGRHVTSDSSGNESISDVIFAAGPQKPRQSRQPNLRTAKARTVGDVKSESPRCPGPQTSPKSPDSPRSPGSPTSSRSSKSPPRSDPQMSAGESVGKRKARASHNEIEKKYRSRLNSQFELLIDTLGLDQPEEGIGAINCPRLHSKAEVLAMAARRIRLLEKEVRLQSDQVDQLKGDLRRVRDAAPCPMISLSSWNIPG